MSKSSSARSRTRLTADQLTCARLAASGEYTLKMIAVYLGKSEVTIRNWLAQDRVMEEFRSIVKANTSATVARARRVLEKSLDSDAANGYLALNAAQTVLAKYDADVMGEDRQEITITISGGMPELGMPRQAESETEDE